MVSKEIYEYLANNKIDQLYKIFKPCFDIIDKWGETFIRGNLLDENELAFALDQATGVFSKLCPIVNALDSYMERILNNEESKYYQSLEKVRTQDTSIGKAQARAKVSDVRDYLSDFKSYLLAAQQNIVSAQSRLKRLTVEKGAKYIDRTGEVPVDNGETVELDDRIINDEPDTRAWDE
jgi:hypothetical protein